MIPNELPEDSTSAAILEDCDKCLGNLLLGLDHESRLMYLFKETCDLSYRMLSKIFEIDEHHIRKSVVKSRRKINNFLDMNCALYTNSAALKTCRSYHIRDCNIADEFRLVRSNSHKANIFLECEILMARESLWQLEE